jgi:D-serine deaminase-like pyridoxal phosphate-dependent protein
MALEEIRCATVGEPCGVVVEVDTAMPRKGVVAAGVGENFSELVVG